MRQPLVDLALTLSAERMLAMMPLADIHHIRAGSPLIPAVMRLRDVGRIRARWFAGAFRPCDEIGEIDIDLVDAAVLDTRRYRTDRGLEKPRIVAIGVEVDRKQYRVRRE